MANSDLTFESARVAPGSIPGMTIVTVEMTADDADGSFPVESIPSNIAEVIKGMFCIGAITIPGSTSPTNLYDILVADENGIDVFGANLENRSESDAEISTPTPTANFPCLGAWSITTTGNSVNSATVTLKLLFSPGPLPIG